MNINIKTLSEIETITSKTIKLDAIEIDHIQKLEKAIKLLDAELKAYKNATLEKYEHKNTNTGTVKITISDYFTFDADRFLAENGQAKYDEYKTKPQHRETVKF